MESSGSNVAIRFSFLSEVISGWTPRHLPRTAHAQILVVGFRAFRTHHWLMVAFRKKVPILLHTRDLRQLRRGYRMWGICGSPDRFLKEATSTPSELRHLSNVGPAVLPHSLRTRLQCDRVKTPFGAGDDAVTDVCQKSDRATVLRNP